jgi:RNA polymerase sigma factor (sigma-70 family)
MRDGAVRRKRNDITHNQQDIAFDAQNIDRVPLHVRATPYQYRPETDIQALMEAGLCEEPLTSKRELYDIGVLLDEALDSLTDLERYVFDACVVERKGIRVVAKQLARSKSGIHVILRRAKKKLAAELQDHPLIIDYLERQA